MKTIITCQNRMEAEIIKAKLEAHGIFAHVTCDDLAGNRPSFTAQHGVSVSVHEKDFESAQEILETED